MKNMIRMNNVNIKHINKAWDNKHMRLVTRLSSFEMVGSICDCFSLLCLKGNRKSVTFLLPFHFVKKEGATC